jgi:hypothetical protein
LRRCTHASVRRWTCRSCAQGIVSDLAAVLAALVGILMERSGGLQWPDNLLITYVTVILCVLDRRLSTSEVYGCYARETESRHKTQLCIKKRRVC